MSSPSDNETFGRRLDLLEQITVLVLYFWFVVRLWPEHLSGPGIAMVLLILSEGLVALFLVIRRPTARISPELRDWLIAMLGTFLPLLVIKGGDPLFEMFGSYLLLAGFLTHVGAKLSLRRSFGIVAANRGVKANGLYALVRHPMYAGYMLAHIGFLLVSPSLWNLLVYTAVWSLLIARIYSEERLLNEDPKYGEYAGVVRYRLLPGVF